MLRNDYGVESDVWAVTSFNELARNGQDVERQTMLDPDGNAATAYVTECLSGRSGPVIASTDYMKAYAEQIRAYVPASYRVLGTDGYGRSDSREQLRHFFEVDRKFVVLAALQSLQQEGKVEAAVVTQAIEQLQIDPAKTNPRLV